MDALRWQRLNDLFHSAVGRDAAERATWLARVCDGDSGLAAEVERLVRAHEQASGDLLSDPRQISIERDFPGTDRFIVRRQLGRGGMGVVYEVHDRARDERVALKTLLRARPDEIYRLKREFRTLADVAHANLVSLYELFVEDEHCFFTMELIDGVTFVDAVRRPAAPASGLDADRLRLLLPQLIDGVTELHRRGKLHRDIKPSNVLVAADGRVVILDFGLVADTSDLPSPMRDRLAGTPAYMSPEQAMGAPASEASDWYAVGATLYEAVTGRVPFTGTFREILEKKAAADPEPPADVTPGVPEDLSALCMDLLCRDPARRLAGGDALRRLGHRGDHDAPPPRPSMSIAGAFVGRERHLGVLRASLDAARAGRTTSVYVCGPSGIGKSALVRRFLSTANARESIVVVAGRCYENESVPYKALDGVVDSLSHYLSSLSRSAVEALMPPDVGALARLFPVLGRVAGAASARTEDPSADPLLLRRRGFAALRDLLARIAATGPLIISIDDLHWADDDSAVLLEELLRPPDSPPVLLLACIRAEEIEAKPFLRAVLGSAGAVPLQLAPLTEDEARALIASVVPADLAIRSDDAVRIAREAEGNPFFLEQLTQHAVLHPGGGGTGGSTLAEMLDGRLGRLPAAARDFLETLAICGRPMPAALIRDASGLAGDERPLVALLRSANFVRSSGSGDRLEVYHDRIREALAASLDAGSVQQRHRRVAQTLVAARIDDPEALFEHYRAGGEYEQASVQAAHAAQKAAAALAFDRAALFYRQAIEFAPGRTGRREWKEGLAEALANAGRTADAATVYLEAAAEASGPQRLEFQRRGADQFLIGGHIDRGVAVMRTVLDAAGIDLPRGPRAAFASLLLRRLLLRWRGLGYTERPAHEIAPEVLLRIDACWSVMTGMAMVNNVRSLDFQSRHLLLALDAGEPYRIARAFAVEAVFYAMLGGAEGRHIERFGRVAARMSERVGHPHAIAFSTLTAGYSAILTGEWKQASHLLDRALTLLRACVGVTWELNGAQSFLIASFLYRGEYKEAADRLAPALAAAKDCGNIYLEAELRTRMQSVLHQVADDPDEADRQTREVMQRWWNGAFTRQHYSSVLGRATTALYRGDGAAAWRLVAENEAAMRRTLQHRVQLLRIEMAFLRGRCALALAADRQGSAARNRLLSVARRQARRLAREQMPWSNGFSHLLSGAVAYQEGRPSAAERCLADAADAFDRADMKMYSAGARRQLGLLQGTRGQALVREAEAWMSSHTVKNPRSMTRMVAPGFPDP